ncbi:hypothetical protein [Pseudobacter ginsenosidimutans]|uniref:Uncharacterized protein n=1 Tax=Pseudobacter ginsenosidimutans TaxID=661488 RepID=A0A4Q7MQT3_9BACT|nr:hypothetical protein [Pseudobacter ginsenosidimutans]QEC42411.1 hypothetical protein FSB84_12180 [Pseudobacter ginsenosidimutans]RZS70738.1 hypothetical protein EV199_2631 [Pseudobacter ginsenosidimutans]
MKNIFIAGSLAALLFASCKKDKAIGPPVEIKPDYALPQGNASTTDNNRIQQLFNNYGSYFLYVYTQKDFEWTQATSTGNSRIDTAVLANPQYAGQMLDFLDDVWLKFLPDAFKKKGGIPYRVFLADSIRQYRTGYPPGMEYLYSDIKVSGKAIGFAGMNSGLSVMTPAQKLTKKNAITAAVWNYYLGNNILEIPAAFYNVSNYTAAAPTTPLNALNPANVEAYRQKGFLPNSYNTVTQAPFEWHNGAYSWTNAKSNDLSSFIFNLTQRTDAQMAPYLTYPLIKQKWDILVNHFQTKYGIDVRAIGNATY